MNEIIIKKSGSNIINELDEIGFDKSYIKQAAGKYCGSAYKIFGLEPHEANILKQTCLSLGFDCAINRNSITCKCDFTDCLIFATKKQYENLILKLNQQPFRLKLLSKKLKEIICGLMPELQIRNFNFDWSEPYIMGILNVTPDSFSDGGQFYTTDNAVKHCFKLIEDGAHIIDIGGESTRPNAVKVSIEEEIERIIPVIKKIRAHNIDIPISVDTRNYETAKSAIDAGADIINDVAEIKENSKMFDFITQNNIPVIVMHSDNVPASTSNFTNGNIIDEIYSALFRKIDILTKSGLEKKNIIADLGIGFGKSIDANISLLQRIDEFKTLNTPLLLGISRKSFIRNSFNISAQEADLPTALYSAMLKPVNIHRVHNVALTKKFLDYSKLLLT